jgi:hypothetical protein
MNYLSINQLRGVCVRILSKLFTTSHKYKKLKDDFNQLSEQSKRFVLSAMNPTKYMKMSLKGLITGTLSKEKQLSSFLIFILTSRLKEPI